MKRHPHDSAEEAEPPAPVSADRFSYAALPSSFEWDDTHHPPEGPQANTVPINTDTPTFHTERSDPNVIDHYRRGELIKRGGNGTVYLGEDVSARAGAGGGRRKVAMKLVQDDPAEERNTSSELRVGLRASGSSPFLVSYEKILPIPPERSLHLGSGFYIVMEYCAGGDLEQDLLKRRTANPKRYLTDDELLHLVYQVGSALRTLHSQNIIHRDVKPGNILLTGTGNYKLGDYGISRSIDPNHAKTTTLGATSDYAPPEYLQDDRTYSTMKDVYSFGCIIVEVIDLCHPFGKAGGFVNIARLLAGNVNPVCAGLSPKQKTVRDMALRLMNPDPHSRPSLQELFLLPDLAALDR